MPLTPIYFNGTWLKERQTCVDILNRGFQFGDGVYEVIPCYHKQPRNLNAHLQRLQQNIAAIGIEIEMPDWHSIVKTLLSSVEAPYCYLYLQISRGDQPSRQFAPLEVASPTLLLYAEPFVLTQHPHPGVTLQLMEDPRWQYCHIKSTNLLGSILAQKQAKEAGFNDALYQRQNQITEASSSNFFAIINNQIVTPPLSQHLLAGITRALCLDLLKQQEKTIAERIISPEELPQIEAAWLCSSTKEILPVQRINEYPLNPNHPIIELMITTYTHYRNALPTV